jgi:hypothetical protein
MNNQRTKALTFPKVRATVPVVIAALLLILKWPGQASAGDTIPREYANRYQDKIAGWGFDGMELEFFPWPGCD